MSGVLGQEEPQGGHHLQPLPMSVTLQADPAWSRVAGSPNDNPSLWRHQSGVPGSVHGNESGEWLRVVGSDGEGVYYDLIDVLLEFN